MRCFTFWMQLQLWSISWVYSMSHFGYCSIINLTKLFLITCNAHFLKCTSLSWSSMVLPPTLGVCSQSCKLFPSTCNSGHSDHRTRFYKTIRLKSWRWTFNVACFGEMASSSPSDLSFLQFILPFKPHVFSTACSWLRKRTYDSGKGFKEISHCTAISDC